MAAPRISVKASQQNGNSRDSPGDPGGGQPARPECHPADHREQGHDGVHELVTKLMYTSQLKDAGQRDMVDEAGDGDRDQSDQPERLEHRRSPIQPQRKQQGRRANDEVRQDGEEREGVEPAGDTAVEVPGSLDRRIDAQRDPGGHTQRRCGEPGPGPFGRHIKIVLAAHRGIEPVVSASR